ncbi:unnamed protein product [Fraxinus pennsylvanica]|uniref:Uncharacterized protein n=1 Tax=Fraxinus pennsylvanica TaxID=56036 RepID=A0AAD1ZGQ4_9LAMI|nr:unnamed protein product [Fraxinus pennsylvanica]
MLRNKKQTEHLPPMTQNQLYNYSVCNKAFHQAFGGQKTSHRKNSTATSSDDGNPSTSTSANNASTASNISGGDMSSKSDVTFSDDGVASHSTSPAPRDFDLNLPVMAEFQLALATPHCISTITWELYCKKKHQSKI